MRTTVEIRHLLFNHEWTILGSVEVGETVDRVTIEEAQGVRNGAFQWWPGAEFMCRVTRLELDAVENALVKKAREQLTASAMRRRAEKG